MLSVIIPVYNEESTVEEVIARVRALPMDLEIIVVDDGSTDGTHDILSVQPDDGVVKVCTSQRNFGKGAAIRTGLDFVHGDIVIIQDADLELDPEEYPQLIGPIEAGRTRVVYGSRFREPTPGVSAKTRLANRMLSAWCNLLFGSRLTDVSTAYKVFRTEVVKGLGLTCVGFEFCAEVTAKLLRAGERIEEAPVGYHPRSSNAGKKLRYWRDGLKAAWWLLKLRFGRSTPVS
jgi:glycosyltransferase involved in cell wall biosynthesis